MMALKGVAASDFDQADRLSAAQIYTWLQIPTAFGSGLVVPLLGVHIVSSGTLSGAGAGIYFAVLALGFVAGARAVRDRVLPDASIAVLFGFAQFMQAASFLLLVSSEPFLVLFAAGIGGIGGGIATPLVPAAIVRAVGAEGSGTLAATRHSIMNAATLAGTAFGTAVYRASSDYFTTLAVACAVLVMLPGFVVLRLAVRFEGVSPGNDDVCAPVSGMPSSREAFLLGFLAGAFLLGIVDTIVPILVGLHSQDGWFAGVFVGINSSMLVVGQYLLRTTRLADRHDFSAISLGGMIIAAFVVAPFALFGVSLGLVIAAAAVSGLAESVFGLTFVPTVASLDATPGEEIRLMSQAALGMHVGLALSSITILGLAPESYSRQTWIILACVVAGAFAAREFAVGLKSRKI